MADHTKKHFSQISIFIVLLFTLNISNSATQLYRYKDTNGAIVLNHTIPAKYVDAGYEILNDKGRVIDIIAPALSAEAIRVRDLKLEKEQQRLEAKKKQDLIDDELKQLFSHPNDAVRILQRRFQDILDVRQIKLGHIDNAKNLIKAEETSAAERQRKGLPVPENMLANIEKQKKVVQREQIDIVELRTELTKLLIEFDLKIRRLEVITEKESSDYPALLKKTDSFLSEEEVKTSRK